MHAQKVARSLAQKARAKKQMAEYSMLCKTASEKVHSLSPSIISEYTFVELVSDGHVLDLVH